MLKDDCLFCRMIKGEIPTTKIYEDEDMIVIKDICGYPKIHYLMIPSLCWYYRDEWWASEYIRKMY